MEKVNDEGSGICAVWNICVVNDLAFVERNRAASFAVHG